MTKKKDQNLPQTIILFYDKLDLELDRRIHEYVADGMHQIEWDGDLQDPYIRAKKVVCYLCNFDAGDGRLYASIVPRAGDKTLPYGWEDVYTFKMVKSPSGRILKLVLVESE